MTRLTLVLGASLLLAVSASAQWLPAGETSGNAKINRPGFVGLGTNDPQLPLHIFQSGAEGIRIERASYGAFDQVVTLLVTGDNIDFVNTAKNASTGFAWQTRNDSNTIVNALGISKNGNVGIGTLSPGATLDVRGGDDTVGGKGIKLAQTNDSTRWLQRIGYSNGSFNLDHYNGAVWSTPMTVLTSGDVGLGTASPNAALDLRRGGPNGSDWNTSLAMMGYGGATNRSFNFQQIGNTATASQYFFLSGTLDMNLANSTVSAPKVMSASAPVFGIESTDGAMSLIAAPYSGAGIAPVRALSVNSAGTVGIHQASPSSAYALDVVGNVRVTGSLTATTVIGAVYQDLAEWVPATETLAPGTVVVLNPGHDNEVMPSHGAYDTSVAGVVSARPGVILGEPGASKAAIATTGRVRVHADARTHPIRIGDLLVTSEEPGTAMRSIPLSLDGVAIHRPGTLIGKALEPLESGTGEILVLLSLQ